MDATQAIVFSDEESEEEHEPGRKKAVAFLQILAQKDFSASKHLIYEGDNFIGRHDSNTIHMPYKALSKQHACIEVQGNSHLIYDMESRNKTRRGKMFLKPNVRYELRDNDVIIFGDVKCQYIVQPEEDDDNDETGSETDSELMLQPPDSEDTGQDENYSKEDENENESSFNLNDFLQPTQPCVPSPKIQFKTPRRLDEGKVFAADSDEEESPNKSNVGGYEDDSFIPETQLSAKKKNDFSVVEESDSDTDIDETGPFDISALASAQTQAVVATQAVDNMATQAVDNMETQAVDNMATQALDNMETQAIDNMATLAVDNVETQAVDNMATLAVDSMETQAIDNVATLAVDNMETQAIDNMATLAVDNMATQAVDNMATQAVDYSADSDSSDTDLDEVGQSMLEAPTQAVGLNDSRQKGTPKKNQQTLVLDSSTASSDSDEGPIKQAGSSRNIFDEPTQVCDGVVSDSGSETDIEEGGMEAETQAVMRDDENKIDEMATVAISQEDDNTTDDEKSMETDLKTRDIEDMATIPIETGVDSDDTDVEDNGDEGVKGKDAKVIVTAKTTDVEDMATVPIAMADDDDDDTDVTDVDEERKDEEEKDAIKDLKKMKDARENKTKLAPTNPDDDDNTEIESELDGASQEYFLNYKTEQNPAEKEGPGPCEVEATQPYGGPSDASSEDASASNHGDDAVFDATQAYGDVNEEDTPGEPAPASSVTMEMSSTQPYGAEGENKQPDSHDDETDPTVPYGAEEDVTMETGDSEIESTQAYGMQGSDTQVPDSQDGDDQATTSSRFPVFKTQSPSRSCLKQPDTPERKATKARRVTFGPADDDEEEGQSDEDDGDNEPQKSGRSRRKPKNSKGSVAPESHSTSSKARRTGSRVSQRNKDEELDVSSKNDAISGRRSTRSKAGNDEVAAKPGQKRKVGALETIAADSSAQTTKDLSSAKRGKRQRGGKVEEEPDGDVRELLTMTDAKPTRRKEFDAENPKPLSRRGSKVKVERKLSDSNISSVGSEGSRTGRALQTIVQIGKKLTRISKRGKKSSEGSEENASNTPDSFGTRRSQRTAGVVDDGDSDDTASMSSTASSIRDFAEVETSTRPTRGTKNLKVSKKVAEEPDGQFNSGARRSRRGGAGQEEVVDSMESEKKSGSRTRRGGVAVETETEVDEQTTQSSSRTLRKGRAKEDETASQDDGQREVPKRVGRGEKTNSQDDGEVGSKRTRRGTVPEVKSDAQEEEPVRNEIANTVEHQSKAVKPSTRGKTKIRSSGDGDQGVQEETSVQEAKGSSASRRSRRATTSESQEESTKETGENNLRQSGRRRTVPARFLDSEGKDKASGSQRPSKHEAEDTISPDAGLFALPKPVGRPSRQQKESPSSSHKETEAETVQTSSRGRRSTAKVPEASVEKEKSDQVEEDSKESRKKGRLVTKPDTSSSIEESKIQENITTPIQRGRRATKLSESVEKGKVEPAKEHSRETSKRGRQATAVKQDASSSKDESTANESTPMQRGRRATTKLSEASAEKERSEDIKEDSSEGNKRGRRLPATKQKPAEESAADESMATPTPRGRRATPPATATKTSRDSKDTERKEQSTEQDKSTEVVKTRGKRGATATPPPSFPAKKPRQTTLPTSQPSPSASPARRARQQTDLTAALSPSLRRRVSDVRPKVMFTGVMDESWQKTVTTLGGELVDSVHGCTHLITDKVRRTVKFLCCVARGVIILTPNWLDESKAAKMFIDAGPFQLKDKASERQHGFSLIQSLQKAGQARLLKGYKIHVTPGVKPEPQQMKDIIKCAGGEYVAKLPTKPIPQMVVVSCDGDKSLWAGPTKVGITVVSSEFILTGILRQDILLKDYKLK